MVNSYNHPDGVSLWACPSQEVFSCYSNFITFFSRTLSTVHDCKTDHSEWGGVLCHTRTSEMRMSPSPVSHCTHALFRYPVFPNNSNNSFRNFARVWILVHPFQSTYTACLVKTARRCEKRSRGNYSFFLLRHSSLTFPSLHQSYHHRGSRFIKRAFFFSVNY